MTLTFDQAWKLGAILLTLGGLYYQAHADHQLLLEQKAAIQHLSNQVLTLQVVVERIDPIKVPFR